jgi:hypothetical protein
MRVVRVLQVEATLPAAVVELVETAVAALVLPVALVV